MQNFQIADLYDIHGEEIKVLEPIFKTYGSKKQFYGEVVTIKCHEDNSLVAENVKKPGQNRVLVVDGGGSTRRALLGDNLAKQAVENGWSGILIFGCIRDSVIINKMNIGVRALNTNPAKTVKRNEGLYNETVHFAGVFIAPGDYIYADEDGVAVSKKNFIG